MAILVRGDVIALRYALLVEHLLPEVRLVVTLFDRTVAEQLVRVIPNCQGTSPANVAVPSIIGACLGPDVLAVERFRRAYLHLSHSTASRSLDYMTRPLSTFVAHPGSWTSGTSGRPRTANGRLID